jgi:hypothetical protein
MLVLALAALIAAGCGGDDDDDGGDSASSTSVVQTETAQTETSPGGSDTTGEQDDSVSGGDDGNGSQSGDGSLTRAAFIRRADKICGEVRPELATNGQKIAALARRAQTGKLKPDDYFRMSAELVEESAKAADGAVDQLEDLPRPEDGRAALERYLAATRDQVDYLYDQAEATRDGDQQEAARLNAVSNRTSARVRAAAGDYGFRVCGGGA